MPMINELVIAMLACARIGAVHSIVFGGYRFVDTQIFHYKRLESQAKSMKSKTNP